MTCSACHRTEKHVIPGFALSVSATPGAATLDCADCHAGTPHKGNKVLDRHAQKVACQTCHGPVETMTTAAGATGPRIGNDLLHLAGFGPAAPPLSMGWCIECHREQNATRGTAAPLDCVACHH